jgi:CBS domain-containing protein
MSVRALLRQKRKGVISVKSTASVAEAARLLMEHGVGGLPVVGSDASLVGFVSERDVVNAVDRHSTNVRDAGVASIMRSPAPVCSSDDPIREVMVRMTRERLRHLVALDQDRIAGVISVGDLVKLRLEQLETEAGVLRDYVAGQRATR